MDKEICNGLLGLWKNTFALAKEDSIKSVRRTFWVIWWNILVWIWKTWQFDVSDYLSVIACVRHIDIIPVTYIDPNEWPLYRDYICNLRKSFMFYLSSQAGSILTQVSQIKVLWSRYESTVFQLTAAPPVADEKYIDNDIYWQHSAFKEVLNLGGMTSNCQL